MAITTNKAYEKWLEVLDKGIGATLEEAGVFDAAFSTEDDEYDDDYSDGGRGRGGGAGGRGFSSGTNNNNLYDKYTNYDYRSSGDGGGRRDEGRGGGDGYGYDPQGRQDERGFDYDDRCGMVAGLRVMGRRRELRFRATFAADVSEHYSLFDVAL